MCTPWLEGGSWTTRYPWNVWVSRRTAPFPSSPVFVVGLVTTCLGSGRVQIALRSVAGQCGSSATGVVHLVMLTLPQRRTEKGKVLKAPWVVLLRNDLALCRPLPAVDHMWSPRVEARLRQELGILLPPFLRMLPSHLQTVMTKEDFSKYEKLVMPPPPKKEEEKKLREEVLWRQCQKEKT